MESQLKARDGLGAGRMPNHDGQSAMGFGVAVERRRPGRREVSPELIPLLRRPVGDGMIQDDFPADGIEGQPALATGRDALAPARGIAMSLLLSVPLWCVVGAVGVRLEPLSRLVTSFERADGGRAPQLAGRPSFLRR